MATFFYEYEKHDVRRYVAAVLVVKEQSSTHDVSSTWTRWTLQTDTISMPMLLYLD